jgi:hypothetical protein
MCGAAYYWYNFVYLVMRRLQLLPIHKAIVMKKDADAVL